MLINMKQVYADSTGGSNSNHGINNNVTRNIYYYLWNDLLWKMCAIMSIYEMLYVYIWNVVCPMILLLLTLRMLQVTSVIKTTKTSFQMLVYSDATCRFISPGNLFQKLEYCAIISCWYMLGSVHLLFRQVHTPVDIQHSRSQHAKC